MPLRIRVVVILRLGQHFLDVLHRDVADELLVALVRSSLYGVVGQEVDTCANDVLRSGEVFLAERALGLQSNLERAETVELHNLRGVQVTVHHIDEFDEHSSYVRVFHRDVLLNLFTDSLQVECASMHGTAEPLTLSQRPVAVVLISAINYSHDCLQIYGFNTSLHVHF